MAKLTGFLALAVIMAGLTLRSPLILDDVSKIVENPDVSCISRSWNECLFPSYVSPASNLHRNDPSRPLTSISYMIIHYFFLDFAGAQRCLNFFCHVLVSALAVRFLRLLGFPSDFSALSGWMFFLSALNINVVQYVYSRSDLLCTLFSLSSLIMYCKAIKRPGFPVVIGSFLSFLAAVAAKQTALALPLTCLVISRHFSKSMTRGALKGSALVILLQLIAATAVMFARFSFFGGVGDVEATDGVWPAREYWMSQAFAIATYIKLYCVPTPLAIDHYVLPVNNFSSPRFLTPITVFLVLFVGASALKITDDRKTSLLVFLFASLVLPLSAVPTVDILVERRAYFPSIPFYAGFAHLARRYLGRTARSVLVLMLLVNAVFSLRQLLLHRDAEHVWRDVLGTYPDSVRARHNLATILSTRGAEGEAEAVRMYRTLVGSWDGDCFALTNLGTLLSQQGDPGELKDSFFYLDKAATLCPHHPPCLYNLALHIHRWNGSLVDAETLYRRAIGADPSYRLAHNNLAVLLMETGRKEEALSLLRSCSQYWPHDPLTLANMEALGTSLRACLMPQSVVRSQVRSIPNKSATGLCCSCSVRRIEEIPQTRAKRQWIT